MNPCTCAHPAYPSGRRALLHSRPPLRGAAAVTSSAAGAGRWRSALGASFPFPPPPPPAAASPGPAFPPVRSALLSSDPRLAPPPPLALLCRLPVPALGTVWSPQSARIWFPFDVKLNSSRLDSAPIRSGCVFAQPC